MAEHPILFSGSMILAILEGRKTQTRRVVRNVTRETLPDGKVYDCIKDWDGEPSRLDIAPDNWEISPYGVAGSHLWVREAWRPTFCMVGEFPQRSCGIVYRAGGKMACGGDWPEDVKWIAGDKRWRPSIHMPRWASRITLEVTAVRVERVQEITEGDIDTEGVTERLVDGVIAKAYARVKAEPEHWISGANQGLSYCPKCCKKEVARLRKCDPDTEYEVDGGWGTEGDGSVTCTTCHVLLENSYTHYGCESELDYFETDGFDINNPSDCYSLEHILGSEVWGEGELAPRIKRLGFQALWDSLNARRGYGWESNPWVFAISFKLVENK